MRIDVEIRHGDRGADRERPAPIERDGVAGVHAANVYTTSMLLPLDGGDGNRAPAA